MRYSGDYGTKVPPLPIPNREVKLRHADGTADCGRVGSRRFPIPGFLFGCRGFFLPLHGQISREYPVFFIRDTDIRLRMFGIDR